MVCFHVVQRPVERWYIVSVVTSSMRHKRNAWSLKISSLVFQSKTLIYQVKDYMIIRGLSQSSVDKIHDLKSVLCNFIRLFGVFSMALWQTALIKSNMCFIYLFIYLLLRKWIIILATTSFARRHNVWRWRFSVLTLLRNDNIYNLFPNMSWIYSRSLQNVISYHCAALNADVVILLRSSEQFNLSQSLKNSLRPKHLLG